MAITYSRNAKDQDMEDIYRKMFGADSLYDQVRIPHHEFRKRVECVEREYEKAQKQRYSITETELQMQQLKMQLQMAGVDSGSAAFNPNQREAFTTPLDTLANMWAAKYGGVWVNTNKPAEDTFWEDAYTRLKNAGRFEQFKNWVILKD